MKKRIGFDSITRGKTIWVVGGINNSGLLDSVESYDIDNDSWTTQTALPIATAYHSISQTSDSLFLNGGVTAVNGKNVPSTQFLLYRFTQDAWSIEKPAFLPRANHSSFIFANSLHLIGGKNQDGNIVSQTETYDISPHQWLLHPFLSQETRYFASAAVGSEIFLFGGRRGPLTLDSVNKLDVSTNTWDTNIARLPIPLSHQIAITYQDEIYLFGGLTQDDEVADMAYRFSPGDNSWSELAAAPTKNDRSAMVRYKGKIYRLGGTQNDTEALAYDIGKNQWQPLANIPNRHAGGTAFVLGDYIYIAGGKDPIRGHNYVDRFNTILGQWESVASLQTGRYDTTSVVINGRAYVIGGSDVYPLSSVEIYDPLNNKWSYGEYARKSITGASGNLIDGYYYLLSGFDTSKSKPAEFVEVFR
jgi:N-acetylneuraminic acid mutarotase